MAVQVFVGARAWGLPSADPLSLAALAWLRFHGVAYMARECDTPLGAPGGELPYAVLPGHKLVAGTDLFNAVAAHVAAGDATAAAPGAATLDLNDMQMAEAAAYEALVHRSLRPAWLYTLWQDPDNFTTTTRKLYGQRLPFPLDYVVPWITRHDIANRLGEGRHVLDRDELFDHASEAVAALAELVAKRPFCFGDKPTRLDALLYGYLAAIIAAPLPVGELQQLVQSYEPLMQFTRRVQRQYFATR